MTDFKYSYEEMQEMVDRWLAGCDEAAKLGDWGTLGKFYTEDALYTWNNGPKTDFVARGRQQIVEWAMGKEMVGLETWHYPYVRNLIDPAKGEFLGIWRQISPVMNSKTGKPYEIVGTGGSWFRYAGDFKWDWQRDFFDLGNATDCYMQMMKNGDMNDALKQRMEKIAQGEPQPGWTQLSEFDWLSTIADREA